MRDVLEVAPLTVVFAELSDLAEACVLFSNQLLGGQDLTIVALGKFGGHELSYGADLDVIFVGAQGMVTAQVSGINQRCARRIQLCHKGIGAESSKVCIGSDRKICGSGRASDVSIASRIYGDAFSFLTAAAAKVG